MAIPFILSYIVLKKINHGRTGSMSLPGAEREPEIRRGIKPDFRMNLEISNKYKIQNYFRKSLDFVFIYTKSG
jgi:hypothetical protein